MHKDVSNRVFGEAVKETSRLLSELDNAIDQSSVMRGIVNRYERLHYLENLTGPSRQTRVLRKEIELMEIKLRVGRGIRLAGPGIYFTPI